MPKIHTQGRVQYIRISELPKDEQQAFREELIGQTIPSIDGLEKDVAYPWDYDEWKSKPVQR